MSKGYSGLFNGTKGAMLAVPGEAVFESYVLTPQGVKDYSYFRNCGWGWATTYIEPILSDSTDYHVVLVSSNNSLTSIKAVSEVANCNYIEAKKLISHAPVEVFHGQAVEVKAIREKLEAANIEIRIEPEFPY